MGKYVIRNAVSYNRIFKENLLRQPSVFGKLVDPAVTHSSIDEDELVSDVEELDLGPKEDGAIIPRLNYLTLFNAHYAYRVRSHCPFENNKIYIFEFFVVNSADSKLADFNLFSNLWRETLLLANIEDPRTQAVLSYGQLPDGIIYREVQEVSGCPLEEYIRQTKEPIAPFD